MDENKKEIETTEKPGLKSAAIDAARGAAIGAAAIIPGFSGGSVAAILGIYEKFVSAVSGIFTSFKKSALTLLPILIGMAIGAVALLYPIEASLGAFPLPTVSLFVGLAIGGLPNITERLKGKITLANLTALLIPFAAALVLMFLPLSSEVDLSALDFGGFVLLFLVGILASSAMVIPGISGSMLLLIIGYYNPVIDLLANKLLKGVQLGSTVVSLLVFALGIAAGFVGISAFMKLMLKRYNRGTYFAILGFITGSIPAIYASVIKDADIDVSVALKDPWTVVASLLLLAVGIALSLLMIKMAKRSAK